VLRRTGYECAAIEQFNQSGPELPRSAVGRVPQRNAAAGSLCEPAHRDELPSGREELEEAEPGGDLPA